MAEFLRGFGQYELFVYGIMLLVAMVFLPKGLVGMVEGIYSFIRGRLKNDYSNV